MQKDFEFLDQKGWKFDEQYLRLESFGNDWKISYFQVKNG